MLTSKELEKIHFQKSMEILYGDERSILIKRLMKSTYLNEFEIEDIIQTVACFCAEKMHLYDPNKSSLKTWLKRILKNKCIDQIRRNESAQKRIKKYALPESHNCSSPDSLAITKIITKESLDFIMEKLNKTKQEEFTKETIILNSIYGFKYENISKIKNIKLGTIKTRVQSTRIRNKDIYERTIAT